MASEQFELDGQVAIVTGAGRGVGEGIAKVLAEAGAAVVGTARTSSEIESTIKDIKAAGGKGLALTADALVRTDSERVVQTTTTSSAVAGAVAWLASDESRYVTAAAIPVDVGVTGT